MIYFKIVAFREARLINMQRDGFEILNRYQKIITYVHFKPSIFNILITTFFTCSKIRCICVFQNEISAGLSIPAFRDGQTDRQTSCYLYIMNTCSKIRCICVFQNEISAGLSMPAFRDRVYGRERSRLIFTPTVQIFA